MYFIPIYNEESYQLLIKPILVDISKRNYDINELINALRKLKIFSSSKKNDKIDSEYKESYHMLSNLFKQNEVIETFAMICTFVLNKENDIKKHKIPILQQGQNIQVILDKSEVFFLLSSMVLNIVPPQQYAKTKGKKEKFCLTHSFSFIFSQEEYKTKTLMSYFIYHFKNQGWKERIEKFVIRRKFLQEPIKIIIDKCENSKMIPYDLRKNNQSIEDFKGQGKVDFANQYIGGGALYSGCVQEQIMFSNNPQLYVSMLLCEVMSPKQSIYLENFRKFSNNIGYGFNTTFDKNYQIDNNTFYSIPNYIIAIDAVPFFGNSCQFTESMVDRELTKAYAGFSNLPEKVDVVTGNWGCGVFGGQVKLKFLIQWIACSMAGKTMIYCPFGERYKIEQGQKVLDILSEMKVVQVYNILIKAISKIVNSADIFEGIAKQLSSKK